MGLRTWVCEEIWRGLSHWARLTVYDRCEVELHLNKYKAEAGFLFIGKEEGDNAGEQRWRSRARDAAVGVRNRGHGAAPREREQTTTASRYRVRARAVEQGLRERAHLGRGSEARRDAGCVHERACRASRRSTEANTCGESCGTRAGMRACVVVCRHVPAAMAAKHRETGATAELCKACGQGMQVHGHARKLARTRA